jgi:hypothetical protein
MSKHALMEPNHWVMRQGQNIPPTPPAITVAFPEGDRITLARAVTHKELRTAARFAIRAATNNGTILDFDPDALIQNLEIALFGSSANLGRLAPADKAEKEE